jgi:hypothetical protein
MKKLSALSFVLAAGLPVAASADGLLVQVPAVLDPSAPIANRVQMECAVPQLVGNHVLSHVAQRQSNVRAAAEVQAGSPDPMLKLTLLSVHGVGGGGWSGPKSATLRAELVDNGRSIATNVVSRSSRGGVLGGVSGTCAIFERIAEALGRDVAVWVPIAMAARAGARQQVAPAPEPAPAAQ